ncbi:MAG: response regulator transcription factor [Bacteroidota bacterium]
MRKTQVFIVDDHYMVIEGIRSLLQQELQIDFCGHASTAASCLSFLSKQLPDVILMDINLPDQSGIDLCRQVHLQYPQVFILGLSTFGQYSFVEKMMAAGASGYLLKNAGQQEIKQAIETVVKGKQYLSHDAAITLRNTHHADLPVLTRREKEVLELIADGSTNGEIAERLFIAVTTVDTHRKNLLLKLNAKNTAALIKIAMENNLI